MRHFLKFTQEKKQVVFAVLVVIVLASAFLVSVLNNQRQDNRTKAVEAVTVPGSYGYGNYQAGDYSTGESPSNVPTRVPTIFVTDTPPPPLPTDPPLPKNKKRINR